MARLSTVEKIQPLLRAVVLGFVLVVLQAYQDTTAVVVLKWGLYCGAIFRAVLAVRIRRGATALFGSELPGFQRRIRELEQTYVTNVAVYFNVWRWYFAIGLILSAAILRGNWLCLGIYVLTQAAEETTVILPAPFGPVTLVLKSSKAVVQCAAWPRRAPA